MQGDPRFETTSWQLFDEAIDNCLNPLINYRHWANSENIDELIKYVPERLHSIVRKIFWDIRDVFPVLEIFSSSAVYLNQKRNFNRCYFLPVKDLLNLQREDLYFISHLLKKCVEFYIRMMKPPYNKNIFQTIGTFGEQDTVFHEFDHFFEALKYIDVGVLSDEEGIVIAMIESRYNRGLLDIGGECYIKLQNCLFLSNSEEEFFKAALICTAPSALSPADIKAANSYLSELTSSDKIEIIKERLLKPKLVIPTEI